jgi:hypothetical protein
MANDAGAGVAAAGRVQIVYGSATGLTKTGTTSFDQRSTSLGGAPETNDYFGGGSPNAAFW